MNRTLSEESFLLPKEATRFVLYQRTHLRSIGGGFVSYILDLISGGLSERFAVLLESNLRKEEIRKSLFADVRSDFFEMQPYLPKRAGAILDIGCGLGVIDLFLNSHYRGTPMFYLVDRNQVEKRIWYGYNRRGAFYNSLDLTRQILVDNGIEEKNIQIIVAPENGVLSIERPIDLCVSLRSLGFHYPIRSYIQSVKKALSPQGAMILDIRHGTDGQLELTNAFLDARIQPIKKTETSTRVIMMRTSI